MLGLAKNTFKGGIHPKSYKELASGVAIIEMPVPDTLYIQLAQHIGKPALPVVNVGDTVKMGQLIAKADGAMSANIFSSVSGTVQAIEKRVALMGKTDHIVISNDHKDTEDALTKLIDPTKEQIIERVRDCGIVGLGGAGFATAIKLSPNKPVDTLVVNAAECEPYINCDYRVMLEYTTQFLKGVNLVARALGVKEPIIGIEDNKPDAISVLKDACKDEFGNIKIAELKTKYPQGGEKQLIFATTAKKVPRGGLPMDVGVVVVNVATALAVYYAVCEGQTLYKRVVTVTGQGIKTSANLWVRVGTSVQDMLQAVGLSDSTTLKLILGGPMMGMAFSDTGVATAKNNNCLLVMTDAETSEYKELPCINCGRCAKACPMNLMPMFMNSSVAAKDIDTAIKYGLKDCIECGCCSFVCPSKIPLVKTFKTGKTLARALKK